MNFKEENSDLFDDYLRGKMNTESKSDFEKKLENDSAFKSEFDSYIEFKEAMEELEIKDIHDYVNSLSTFKARRLNVFKYSAAAALIGIIVTVGFFLNRSSTQIVQDYFTPYQNVVTTRGENKKIEQALSLYDAGKYQEAIDELNEIENNLTAKLYTAESFMALEQYSEAIELYDFILTKKTIFSEVAEFHIALAYLGMNDKAEAKKRLNSIEKESVYFDQATLLLEDL